MNKIISSIHGNLCGDGCVYSYMISRDINDIIKYKRRKSKTLRCGIIYTNNSKELLNKFRKNMRILFPNIKFSNYKNNEVRIRNNSIAKYFYKYGDFGSRKWRIPKEIKYSNNKIKCEWLRSFFDDEATISGRRIIVSSVNKNGLVDVKYILNSLKIKNKLFDYYKTCLKYNLVIYNIQKYKSLISFDHKLKIIKLNSLIKNLDTFKK